MLKIQILGNSVIRRNLPTLLVEGNGSDSKDRASEHEVHKPSIHDEGLPLPTKEVGNHSRILNMCN